MRPPSRAGSHPVGPSSWRFELQVMVEPDVPNDYGATITRLAGLSPIEYAREKSIAAKFLGVGPGAIDAATRVERKRIAQEAEDERQRLEQEAAAAGAQAPGEPDLLNRAGAVARLVAIDDLAAYQTELEFEASRLKVQKKVLNADVQAQRRQVKQRKIDGTVAAVMERMNSQYSVVLEGGKILVYKTAYDPIFKRDSIV